MAKVGEVCMGKWVGKVNVLGAVLVATYGMGTAKAQSLSRIAKDAGTCSWRASSLIM